MVVRKFDVSHAQAFSQARRPTPKDSGLPYIILGAGKPFSGAQHTALRFANGSSRVLDWALRAVSFASPKPHFVCGYQAEEIQAGYPEFSFYKNDHWETTRAAWSLLLGLPDHDTECVVSYSDILFRQSAAKLLLNQRNDIDIAIDSLWRTRYAGRQQEDLERCEKVCLAGTRITRLGTNIATTLANAEFIGLVRFSDKAIARLRELRDSNNFDRNFLRQASLSDLIEMLRIEGMRVGAIDVKGDWAELNESADLARFVLGTKAQTLRRLRGMVKHARIEDQVDFTVESWRADPERWLSAIRHLGKTKVVVRSSALSEDGFHNSNAGAYTSLLNVDSRCLNALNQAIEQVIASYPDRNPANEVLIQPMLGNVLASGVVFTRTLAHGAPYYVVNYDDTSGSTESITGGTSKEHKTLVIRRDSRPDNCVIPELLRPLLPTLREIESLLSYDSLDIEFAVTKDAGLHILQVRPIAVNHSLWSDADTRFYQLLEQAEDSFITRQARSPFVQGKRTVFGLMPDWNPAEIIGTKPNQLAISLYRDLIMDSTWAIQRAEYGYRDVTPHPLLSIFAGHPYVDVRASLNSFIPAELPDELAARIVDFCIDWLESHPHLHDKIEFEVIPTCYTLDFPQWETHFGERAGLSKSELAQWRAALQALTARAVHSIGSHLTRIEKLESRFQLLKESRLPLLGKAFALLEDARNYGTRPFAHLARSAFVAIALLRSAVVKGVITQLEFDDFLNTIRTVSHAFTLDARACANGELEWTAFVERYGHLRPGTYDITSPSYQHDPERYLRPTINNALESTPDANHKAGNLWKAARERFASAINSAGLPGSADELEMFMRQAIEGREYSKFAFTRNLSAALDALRDWGESIGIDAETLGQVGIDDLRTIYCGQIADQDLASWITHLASRASINRDVVKAIELPPLLCKKEDFAVFQYPATQANFIGNKAITASCVDLADNNDDINLAGCIVLIPQADPGYDWLFARRIGGLITMYGGANSHMAIRAAEFGLPAAIGVGEVRYKTLSAARALELNPINRVIRVLR